MQTKLEAPLTVPSPRKDPAVALCGVGRRYRSTRGSVRALDRLDLELREHELVAVLGPSGCGKSTMLELIAGLQEPDAGEVAVMGSSVARDRLNACAYMPQRDLLLPWRDVLSNAALALECQGVGGAEARRCALPLFARFGLAGFEHALPRELSGGMRQRVSFLRTLLTGRPVLLLDEPFASLDSIARASMQQWLADALAAEPRTVVAVTHDVDEALYLADRVAVLSGRPGHVVAEIEVDRARPRNRRETVTSAAFGALKQHALEALGC